MRKAEQERRATKMCMMGFTCNTNGQVGTQFNKRK